MKKMIVSLADITRGQGSGAGDRGRNKKAATIWCYCFSSDPGPRPLAPGPSTLSLAFCGLQLANLGGGFAVVDVRAIDFHENVERLVELAKLFVAQGNFVAQRLVFVLLTPGNLQAALEPRDGDLRHLLALEADAEHVAALDVIAA